MNRIEHAIKCRCEAYPDSPCLFFEGVTWTRRELDQAADRCEASLVSAGFTSGQRLVTMMPNCPAVLALSIAVWRLGGTMVPLNAKAGREMLGAALGLLDPFAVMVMTGMEELASAIEAQGVPASVVSPFGEIAHFTGRTGLPESEDLAVIFATSGTTGMPKAVPITHGNLLNNVYTVKDHVSTLREDGEDIALNVLPNFHTFGFCLSGILPLVLGYPQVILPSFLPPARTVEAIYSHKVSVIIAVPTIVALICEAVARSGMAPPESLNMIVCGGAPLDPRVHDRAERFLGIPIHEGYGLTECSPVVGAAHDRSGFRPGQIGPVMEGYEVQLRDREGKAIERNEGILWVRGPSVTSGYFRSPEATAQRFDKERWFNTGDVVRFDEDGYFTVLDRDTDIIIVGGFNVYPQEVENILASFQGVKEAAVVGTPHGLSGEVPKAFVVLQEGASVESRDLISFCKERLSHYKVPRKVEFVEELPRSAIGKVLRRTLRDLERSRSRDKSQ